MNGFFSGILIKLFAGGLICAVTLILAGNGAQREVARLACAAFMIILIFSGLGSVRDLKAIVSNFNMQAVELEVDKAVANTIETQKEQISEKLSAYIEEQASNVGIICEISISYAEGQEYAPQKISVITAEGITQAQKITLGNIITQSSNVDSAIIEYK